MSGADLFFIFVVIFFASLMIANIVVTVNEPKSKEKKPKDNKLKKIRNKTIKRKNNNELKKIIRECSKAYKDGRSYFSEVVHYKYFDYIKNSLISWCETNNIEYDLTYYDSSLGMTIRIEFKEDLDA